MSETTYRAGDVANGHVLQTDGQWLPVPVSSTPVKKKKKIFLWTFLAIQALFIIWIIAGTAGASGTPADCGTLDAATCNDAESVGTGIGIFLVVIFWMMVDFLLGVGYGVYRLAKRP